MAIPIPERAGEKETTGLDAAAELYSAVAFFMRCL
jgi:hypothetical protein